MARIRNLTDIAAYAGSCRLAGRVFVWSKTAPRAEERALVEQVRRSSRAVGANIAEAWRRRRYPRAFIRSLTDAESEAEETRHWLRVARDCGYIAPDAHRALDDAYDRLLGRLVRMVQTARKWSPDYPAGREREVAERHSPPVPPSPRKGGVAGRGSPRQSAMRRKQDHPAHQARP